MKTLVTGATGFVGREVLRQLHAAGHSVRALVRKPDSRTARELADQFHAELCPGNVLDAASLSTAFSGVEAVIHLVGIISEIGEQTFENVHTRATQNVVNATKQAGVRRFVQMSALGTRPDAVSRYHQTKWQAEEVVRASGLDWTIFRPSLIYGREDHFVNLFARMSRFSPVLPVMGAGTTKLQPVAVEMVAASFVRALTKPETIGQIHDVCGPEHLTMPQILRTILEVTGRRRWIVRIPMPLARLQAVMLEWVFPTLLRQAPPLNRDQLLMLTQDNTGDERVTSELTGKKSPSFREGIARYLTKPVQH